MINKNEIKALIKHISCDCELNSSNLVVQLAIQIKIEYSNIRMSMWVQKLS